MRSDWTAGGERDRGRRQINVAGERIEYGDAVQHTPRGVIRAPISLMEGVAERDRKANFTRQGPGTAADGYDPGEIVHIRTDGTILMIFREIWRVSEFLTVLPGENCVIELRNGKIVGKAA